MSFGSGFGAELVPSAGAELFGVMLSAGLTTALEGRELK